MKVLSKILLATDFSESSTIAMKHAIALAKKFDSEIYLIHVLPKLDGNRYDKNKVSEVAFDKLTNIRDIIEANGVNFNNIIIKEGKIIFHICHEADINDIDIIIVGSGNHDTKSFLNLGLTAEKLVRNAYKPVWVVKDDYDQGIKSILVPVDLSESSKRALKSGIFLSRKFKAKLTILTVIEKNILDYLGDHINEFITKSKENIKEETKAKLNEFLTNIILEDLDVENKLIFGKPSFEIVREIKENKHDLLILGLLGQTLDPTMIIGSVAEKVIRTLPCSIIAMKSEQALRLRLELQLNNIADIFKQAMELLKEGFFDEAIVQFQLCLTKNPLYLPALIKLEEVYRKAGNTKEQERSQNRIKDIRQMLWEKMVENDSRRHF
ncbi:MAG: universal stress protein [Pseudomonadota bacterium]